MVRPRSRDVPGSGLSEPFLLRKRSQLMEKPLLKRGRTGAPPSDFLIVLIENHHNGNGTASTCQMGVHEVQVLVPG